MVTDPASSACSGSLPARLEPQGFLGVQGQTWNDTIRDFFACVPTGIATSKFSLLCTSVVSEYPLLSMQVLEVTDVEIRVVTAHDWRIATGCRMVVSDSKEWFRHDSTLLLITTLRT
jgi:hypothetical protein